MNTGNAFTRLTPTPDAIANAMSERKIRKPRRPTKNTKPESNALKERYPTPNTGTPVSSESDLLKIENSPRDLKRPFSSENCIDMLLSSTKSVDNEQQENIKFTPPSFSFDAGRSNRSPLCDMGNSIHYKESDPNDLASGDFLFCDEAPFDSADSKSCYDESLDNFFGAPGQPYSRVHTPNASYTHSRQASVESTCSLPNEPATSTPPNSEQNWSGFTFSLPMPAGVQLPIQVEAIRPVAKKVKPVTPPKPKLRLDKETILSMVHDENTREDIAATFIQFESALEDELFFVGVRNTDILNKHQDISADMWEMVCRWLLEVATDRVMFRRTFHLALHFFMCFMHKYPNHPVSTFQMLGVTCIYVAAKFEETEPQIIDGYVEFVRENAAPHEAEEQFQSAIVHTHKFEHKLMTAVDWRFSAPLSIDYLGRYFQYASIVAPREIQPLPPLLAAAAVQPYPGDIYAAQFDGIIFAKAASLLDKAVMRYDSLKFPYDKLAASAFYLVYTEEMQEEEREKLTKCITGYDMVIEQFVEIAANQNTPYGIIYHQLPLAEFFQQSD